MAGKRSNTPPTEPTAPGTGPAPATKKEAVRLALKARVHSPTQIAEYLKRMFGMDITPAHVSTIKGTLKRKKKGRKRKTPGGKKPAEAPADRAVPAASKSKPAEQTPPGGLTLGDLSTLVEMARRAGGIDRLVAYLEVLKGIR